MVVGIIGGRGGTGKTSQLITVARMFSTTRWAYMEKKDEANLENIKEIDSIRIHAIDNDFNDSPLGMLKLFETWRNGVEWHTGLLVVEASKVKEGAGNENE